MREEHVLACLSASPSNPHILNSAAQMAKAFDAAFTAVYIEPINRRLNEEDEQRLHENMEYATHLGARVEIVPGDDTAYQIAAFASFSGVTKIVTGTALTRKMFSGKTMTEQLISYVNGIDVYIIPDQAAASRKHDYPVFLTRAGFTWKDTLISALAMTIATAAGLWFRRMDMADSNIIPLYILAVLVISVVTTRSAYGMGASVLSVFVFNFFFTEPIYTLRSYDPSYWITFVVMLISALITSSLAVRIKQYAGETAQRAYRTQTLLDTNQMLQKTYVNREIISAAADQLHKLLDVDLVFYLAEKGELGEPHIFSMHNNPHQNWLLDGERKAAEWCFANHKAAGRGTQNHKDSFLLYLAVYFQENAYGVIGIDMGREEMDPFVYSLVISILGECGLAMENAQNIHDKEEAAVYAKNQQLRGDLLRTLSHDLRTPLTSISGNASNLLENEQRLDPEMRKRIYEDIEEDAAWLIDTVENLLAATRLEDGKMSLHMHGELLDEVVKEAVRRTQRAAAKHHIIVEENDDIMLVKMDSRLILQVIINIIGNALKYTPEGSEIRIKMFRKDKMACVSVIDNGPGIPDEGKKHVFEMFYTGEKKIADSRRSLGLGLALCRSIAEAHDGIITVTDNDPHGCIFTVELPEEEVVLHE